MSQHKLNPLRASIKSLQTMNLRTLTLTAALTGLLIGCGGSSDSDDSSSDNNTNVTPSTETPSANFNFDTLNVPNTYSFDSQFEAGTSSVAYPGQTMRHLLINDMVQAILGLENNSSQDVTALMNAFFEFDDSSSGSNNYQLALKNDDVATPGPTYNDVSTGKKLSNKIASEDPSDLPAGEFFGWSLDQADPTPTGLFNVFVEQLHAIATDQLAEQVPLSDGNTADIDVPYVSKEGVDYRQMIQKYLLGAVAYSQGTADYLKTDFSTGNSVAAEGKPYSSPQHKWDEAFGYFGAARDYNNYTDDEIASKGGRPEYANGYYDSNGDGLIDLYSEYNWGHSTNCAKRDRGTANGAAPTDFTQTAIDAFLTGRAILNSTNEELSEEALAALQNQALIASQTWEKCIAATVVHYINDTLDDMDAFGANGYTDLAAFKDHAKHWSEMKGFALGLQFNPDSPFLADAASIEKLKTVLSLMGDAPVLADGTQNGTAFAGGVDQFRADLLEARTILADTYSFDSTNVENW